MGTNLSQLSNCKLKKRFESTNLSATVMKQRNDQRKPAHAGTMELSFQCTCKILQRDVHPHARLAGGTAVGSSSPRSDTHSCPRAHTWTHTWGEAHTLGHIVTLPPALPPGLDDLLNSSNYQALTDRQIRPEQGCWGLHGRSDPETQTQRDKHGFPRERRKWKKLTFHQRILPLITVRIFTCSPHQTRLRLFCSFRVTDESASILS